MQNTATLIDNIFVTEKLHRFFESAVLLTDISDHLASLVLLKQTKLLDKKPLEFESQSLNDQKLKQIKNKLIQTDCSKVLNKGNSNAQFNTFLTYLQETMDQISPTTNVRISSKCHFVEPWMTRGLEISSR